MALSVKPVIQALVFLGVLLLVEGICLLASGRSIRLGSRANRRLEMLSRGTGREAVPERLRKEMNQHGRGRRVPVHALRARQAERASIAFSPAQPVGLMALLALAACAGLTLATGAGPPIRAAVAAAMGVGGIAVWVQRRARRRMDPIEEQLADAIDLMVRSLRLGHPFSSALSAVATEIPDPPGPEMGVIADEAAWGRDTGAALNSMADRLDRQDLRFLAVAVTIQQSSGGNLAEVLAGLSKVIRARFRLFRRVKAITAEAKWSGWFLSAFPLGALAMLLTLQPDYFDDVKGTAYFLPVSIVVGVFLMAHVFVMRALVNIEV